MGGRPRRKTGKDQFTVESIEPSSGDGLSVLIQPPRYGKCGGKGACNLNHEDLEEAFKTPLGIHGGYLPHLIAVMDDIKRCKSVDELTGLRPRPDPAHGFREARRGILTRFGMGLVEHTHEEDQSVYEGLFRFRVTSRARLWASVDTGANQVRILFWDPCHRLGRDGEEPPARLDVWSAPESGEKSLDETHQLADPPYRQG